MQPTRLLGPKTTEGLLLKTIELSSEAFDEIEQKLLAAGYDWLVFPPRDKIPMDGFVIAKRR